MAERFGRLDILVNNAAVFVTAPLHDRVNNLSDLERQFAINVGGVAAAVRAAVPVISDGGRISSIGSIAGEVSPFPGIADYSATKGAIAAYTRGWARDLGPRGITVNNVQPGPIDTDMNPASNGDFSAAQSKATALGRYGKPEEVAAAVGRHAYLVPAQGSVEVNGVRIDARDGAAIADEALLAVKALEDAEVILVDSA